MNRDIIPCSSPSREQETGGELLVACRGPVVGQDKQLSTGLVAKPRQCKKVTDDNDLLAFNIVRGQLFLQAQIFDEFNRPILKVINNELVYSTNIWDIKFVGRTLTLRDEPRRVLCEFSVEPPGTVIIRRARLLCNGVKVIVQPEYVYVPNDNTTLRSLTLWGQNGIQLGRNDRNLSFVLGHPAEQVPRYHLDADRVARGAKEVADFFRGEPRVIEAQPGDVRGV